MNEIGAIVDLLQRDGLVQDPVARLTPLVGGVSCEVWLVEDGARRFVVKRALPKLKVKEEWFADVKRNQSEWEFIRYVARFLPQAVPALQYCSATDNYFAMEHLNGSFVNWKELLLAGNADLGKATSAGNLLAQIHWQSTADADAARRFDTTPNFFQLRIEPYLLATGAKHPALRSIFEAEAARLAGIRECLVHGDFSPKNILVSADRMVLLDGEVAWYGDPAFDVAFFLTHLCLKALLHAPRDTGMRLMAETFWQTYQVVRPVPELEARVSRLLLMLLLARVDGKSPVEYLNSARQEFVRKFVCAELLEQGSSLAGVICAWFFSLPRF